MIAKGVRFNAEKKQVGNYYSTKVRFADSSECLKLWIENVIYVKYVCVSWEIIVDAIIGVT